MKRKARSNNIEMMLVVLVLSFFHLRHLSRVEFHIDESHWIGTSYMFEAFLKGEFWSDAWKESHETVTNPPVPRYVIGLGRSVGGYHRRDINRIWQYDRDFDSNVRLGAMPSDGLLWWSRFPMAMLSVAATAIAFWFVRRVAGRIAGYMWILWTTASAFLLVHTRRAMAESPILFFVMVAAVSIYVAIERIAVDHESTRPKTWLYLGIAAISIGLAGTSKLNGLAALGAAILCIGAALWKCKGSTRVRLIRFVVYSLFLVTLTSVAFVGSYPYLWPDPWARTFHLLQNRVEEMHIQTVVFPSSHIDTWYERLVTVPRLVLQHYSSFPFRGAFFFNLTLLVLGAAVTSHGIHDWAKGRGPDGAPLVFLSTALTVSLPPLFTPLAWDRYFLFPVFFSSMTFAIALGWLVQRVIASNWSAKRFFQW